MKEDIKVRNSDGEYRDAQLSLNKEGITFSKDGITSDFTYSDVVIVTAQVRDGYVLCNIKDNVGKYTKVKLSNNSLSKFVKWLEENDITNELSDRLDGINELVLSGREKEIYDHIDVDTNVNSSSVSSTLYFFICIACIVGLIWYFVSPIM